MTRYRISGSVMTHPKRLAAAEALARSAPPGALHVVTDPDPDGEPSALRTALVAWSSVAEGATHHLVLQDDLILSEAFFERVQRAVEQRPEAALALFALWDSRNGAAVRLAAMAGARWVRAVNEYFPCLAVVLPREVATDYVRYGTSRLGAWPDDILLRQFLRSRGVPAYVAAPSLVEHDDRGSISGNAFRGPRRSVCFLPDDRGGDESISLDRPQVVPFFKNGTAQCAVRVAGPGPERWLHLECKDYLSGLGVNVNRYKSANVELTEAPDPEAARETWLTAFTMGFAHRAEGRGDVLSRTAACTEALATIGPGGVSARQNEERIAELRAGLAEVATAGVTAGLDAGRTAGARPVRSGRRVTVLGAASPLGEHVVHGLTARGHRVALGSPGGTAAPGTRSGRDALVDLRPLRRTADSGDTGVLVRSADGPAVTLRTGDLYGPGCSPRTPIGRMVWNALRSRPVVLTDPPGRPLRPLHTYDLVGALCRVLDDPPAAEVLELPEETPVSPGAMAEAVLSAVRPVGVATVTAPPRTAPVPEVRGSGAPRLQGWKPTVDLRHGLHTYMQWLAYEGLALSGA
ncbi:hypothetical protein ACFWIA_25450 [Streptomyces sp. NPDC127068]|uniref:hypothetical protein n=1 Tax=Streptomyces sp. NPDC127068 TaxID=3347127 RepID=UPI00365C6827